MTSEDYFRRAAFLPIVVPIVVLVIDVIREALMGGVVPTWFGSVADVLIPSLLYFGPLYLGLVAVALTWLRGKPLRAYFAMGLIAPLLMLLAIRLAFGNPGKLSFLQWMAFWGRHTLAVGYSYCALALLGFWLGKRTGMIANES